MRPRGRIMPKTNLSPVFHLMGELGFQSFTIVAVDKQGEPAVIFRSNSAAGERAVRGFMEDYLDEQAHLSVGPFGRSDEG